MRPEDTYPVKIVKVKVPVLDPAAVEAYADGAANDAITVHEANENPHPQYVNPPMPDFTTYFLWGV